MEKTQVIFLCLSLFWMLSYAQRPTDEDDGLYYPEKYIGPDGDNGQYIHDNSGQYVIDNSGQYRYDGRGSYRPDIPAFYRYKGNLNKFRSGSVRENFAGNNFARSNNQPKDFENDFANFGKSTIKSNSVSSASVSNYQGDQFVSSTAAPVARILHKKPLQGLKNIDYLQKTFNTNLGNQNNNYFGNSGSGTSFNSKSTHAPIRFPSKYIQGHYDESGALILKQNGDVASDGYHWDFETENGIQAEETGKIANKGNNLEAMRAKGFFKYTGPDNKVYSIMYTADENGFVAEGNHLPTPPPIPDEILKSLSYERASGPRGKF